MAFDVAVVVHLLERDIAVQLGATQIGPGRGAGRRANNSREQRALGHSEVDGVLVEIAPRRGTDAEVPLPEINPVEVVIHDLILGEILLQTDGQESLEELAVQGAGEITDEMFRELLLDRAAALHAVRVLAQILPQRPENAPVIDRAMLIVAAIFRRHDGLTHGFRDLLGLQLDAILDKDAAKFLAIDVIKGRSEIKIVELAEIKRLGASPVVERFFINEIAADRRHDDEENQANLRNEPELVQPGALPRLIRATGGRPFQPARLRQSPGSALAADRTFLGRGRGRAGIDALGHNGL